MLTSKTRELIHMTSLFSEPARDPLDFNRTPAWCVELLIPELGQPRTILDAGCGDGAIGKVLRQAWPNARINGIEVDATRARTARENAGYSHIWHNKFELLFDNDAELFAAWAFDLIISNPPFGLMALDFLRCALTRVRPGGTVAFLLPTHWDHDPDAKTEFARQRFLDSIRLPDGREGYAKLAIVGGGKNPCRPAFRGGSSTATDRYAWFMFGEPWAGQPSRRLHAIPSAVESVQLEITC
jgi:SAM-dependent methyltransferase